MEKRLYPKLILDALSHVRYPGTGKDIVSSGMVEDDIRIDGMKVSFSLIFDKPTDPFVKSLVKSAEAAIKTYVGEEVDITGNIATKFRTAAPAKPANPLPDVKNIIGMKIMKMVTIVTWYAIRYFPVFCVKRIRLIESTTRNAATAAVCHISMVILINTVNKLTITPPRARILNNLMRKSSVWPKNLVLMSVINVINTAPLPFPALYSCRNSSIQPR